MKNISNDGSLPIQSSVERVLFNLYLLLYGRQRCYNKIDIEADNYR